MPDHEPVSHDEDSLEIQPRPVDEVVLRAVLLVTLVRRAALELTEAQKTREDSFERDTDRFELYSWVKKELLSLATGDELSLLRVPVGEMAEDQVNACLSAAGPAAALGWSLGIVDKLDAADADEMSIEQLMTWAPEPWDEVARLARRSALRTDDMLARERERWELWHWRSALNPDDLEHGEDADVMIAEVAAEADAAGLVPQAGGDLAANGRPFGSLPDDVQAGIADLAADYLHALNWVCGFGERWSDVPLYPE